MRFRQWVLGTTLLAPLAAVAAPAEVAVLSTLHRLHAEVPAYDNAAFAAAIERLQPDVLCLEVGPAAWQARRPERTKVEYPEVVYPLLARHGWEVCLLEPEGESAQAIAGPYIAASQALHAAQPDVAAAFDAYSEALYAALKQHWRSPAAVNDTVTDALLQAKHALQEALGGEGERAGWQAWNQYFLDRISAAVAAHPGRRIVVLAGAEHGYWLRRELAGRDDLHLLDTAALLDD